MSKSWYSQYCSMIHVNAHIYIYIFVQHDTTTVYHTDIIVSLHSYIPTKLDTYAQMHIHSCMLAYVHPYVHPDRQADRQTWTCAHTGTYTHTITCSWRSIVYNMHVYRLARIWLRVCVCNIWADAKLLNAGGPWTHRWHGPTKTHLCRRANVPAIFQFIVNGNRLSQEPDLSSLLKSNCMWGGFSSERITSMIHFLSSVISMVTPTWCHGANWGNPV